ncbi:hypothetical protein PF005_g8460 [Phytophthora fragariae]|uniref:Flavodoxin-like domain-containing protein n=1 Tax=Phytophthora fragariae TaxID=53985 RepID=A0A6A3YHS3_9STRA|nr:hypothetical protein PF003_g18997 [Phytophthora fragariae]KAE8959812.1 hypothetical protein PF011_g30313 [Phytophthora fragariae]KAE9119028.1 hypothetical protein PF007_g8716 [Phytophthora fragariae]KAE9217988.1 hypothetical protein PF005_g8460 [Phytophthora fragariae]KAE9240364.1 hypothetical protein PF004_g7527 [Phytophthora fragariae]
MAKIAIIYYSTYGHIATLAESVKEGVESVPGVTAEIYQVPETLPEEVLAKLHAAPKKDHAIARASEYGIVNTIISINIRPYIY